MLCSPPPASTTPTNTQLLRAVLECDLDRLERMPSECIRNYERPAPSARSLVRELLRLQKPHRLEALVWLVNKGAHTDIKNGFGLTPLLDVLTTAIHSQEDRSRALEALLSSGSNPNDSIRMDHANIRGHWSIERTSSGQATALALAAQVGDLDALEILLRHGAAPNGVEPGSVFSPLSMAVRSRQPRCVLRLLRAGAEPDGHDADGLPPVSFVHDMESLHGLLAAGVALDRRLDRSGATLLALWTEVTLDDAMLRWLADLHPHQIWDPDAHGSTAASRLLNRWMSSGEPWIPPLLEEWQFDALQAATVRPTPLLLPPPHRL